YMIDFAKWQLQLLKMQELGFLRKGSLKHFTMMMMKCSMLRRMKLWIKKNRFYIVSALTDTKVDPKVLSQRLGLGKGGLRMTLEEALSEILQGTALVVLAGLVAALILSLATPFFFSV
ncbi:hypothetical protein S83_026577, partial [Arachis hypogaea]